MLELYCRVTRDPLLSGLHGRSQGGARGARAPPTSLSQVYKSYLMPEFANNYWPNTMPMPIMAIVGILISCTYSYTMHDSDRALH